MSDIYNATITRTITINKVVIEGGSVISATPSKLYIQRENTQTLKVYGVFDNEADQFWNSTAVMSAKLYDQFGNTVLTVTLNYVTNSFGDFSGDFGDANFLPEVARGYTVVIKGSYAGRALSIPIIAEVIQSPLFSGAITGTGGTVPPPPSPIRYIYQGNSQDITVNALQDNNTGVFLNAATLTATLFDPNNVAVPGCIGVPLPYIPASDGDYQGFFGDLSFQPPVGTGYNLVVSGSQASTDIEISYPAQVVVRSN